MRPPACRARITCERGAQHVGLQDAKIPLAAVRRGVDRCRGRHTGLYRGRHQLHARCRNCARETPLTLLAILAAGISGYWIGWRLIDPNGDCDSLVAPFLGAAICLLAYYLLGVLVAVPETVQTMAAHNTFTPLFLLLAPLAASPWIFVGAPYFVLRYGIPLTWYTFPVACIAGFVLSFCYRRRRN